MLTDEQLTELFRYSFSLIDSRMTPNQQAFCRAIESAACAERDARIAELERENARLKTVPMKYRRMVFNAELQEKVAELERQLHEQAVSLAEARRDAERYRWLKKGCNDKWTRATHIAKEYFGFEWDAAIDAVMKKEQQ